ncbi:hypothetical protein KUTeg_024179 [Tegillarca granosa]|uniref:Uncharacterized protein n=1 Tax=Tegillarca granosa TaxID=220873 RepID=A0ABQ9DWK7_TEGGR|nr:hypothetical protein KUTeg_024179 [Tegillarca granosa]
MCTGDWDRHRNNHMSGPNRWVYKEINLNSKVRDCISAEPTEPTICEEHTAIEEDRAVLSQVVSLLSSVSFLSFKGTRCLSSTGVGAGNPVMVDVTLLMICLMCALILLKRQ